MLKVWLQYWVVIISSIPAGLLYVWLMKLGISSNLAFTFSVCLCLSLTYFIQRLFIKNIITSPSPLTVGPLVTERALDACGTFQLVEEFLKVSRNFESAAYPSLLRSPYWWILKNTRVLERVRQRHLAKLSSYRRNLIGELANRYAGILHQIFTSTEQNGSFEDYLMGVWYKFMIAAMTVKDYRLFSVTLWNVSQSIAVSNIEQFKPMFMLRQFVDEMPPGEARATLKILAYGSTARLDSLASPELPRLVRQAYHLLYEQILAHADDLEVLTDSVLSRDTVAKLHPPFVEFHKWLFQTNDLKIVPFNNIQAPRTELRSALSRVFEIFNHEDKTSPSLAF